jgi:hypothetical protein
MPRTSLNGGPAGGVDTPSCKGRPFNHSTAERGIVGVRRGGGAEAACLLRRSVAACAHNCADWLACRTLACLSLATVPTFSESQASFSSPAVAAGASLSGEKFV